MVTILQPVNINPNWGTLRREIQATYPGATITDYPRLAPQISEIVVTHDDVTVQGLETIIAAHNPETLTTGQAEAAQAVNAKTALQNLMTGLHGLSAEDKGYAIYCRLLAYRNNAAQQTIFGIVDRDTAAAYVTSLPQWTNVPATSKPMLQLMLETNAALTQVLLLVLSG